MTNDHITDALSAWADDELDATERARVERHVARCAECSAELDAVRRVRDQARALADHEPSSASADAIWARVAAGAGFRAAGAPPVASAPDASMNDATVTPLHAVPARRRRTLTVTIPQLVAAGIALVLLSGGVVWRLARVAPAATEQIASGTPETRDATADSPLVLAPDGTPVRPARGAAAAAAAAAGPALAGPAPRQYAAAVEDLESALQQNRARLDSATVRAIEESLATIDRAITEARAALARDPENAYLNDHLAATMARKLRLLRDAAIVAGDQS